MIEERPSHIAVLFEEVRNNETTIGEIRALRHTKDFVWLSEENDTGEVLDYLRSNDLPGASVLTGRSHDQLLEWARELGWNV